MMVFCPGSFCRLLRFRRAERGGFPGSADANAARGFPLISRMLREAGRLYAGPRLPL